MLTPREIAEAAVRTLDAKMAKDIKLLCTTEQTVLAGQAFLLRTPSAAALRSRVAIVVFGTVKRH